MPLVGASLSYGALFYLPVVFQSIERIEQPCRCCNMALIASSPGLDKTGLNRTKLTLT